MLVTIVTFVMVGMCPTPMRRVSMIIIDKHSAEWCSIDTEQWLQQVTDEEITEQVAELVNLEGWLTEKDAVLVGAISQLSDCHFQDQIPFKFTRVENTYNSENDFSSEFQFMIIYPEDEDWAYSDCYLAVEVHQGGDVRGNYGPIRVFKCSNLAEQGFFDWCFGWMVVTSDGERSDRADEFQIGYAANPTSQLMSNVTELDKSKRWPELHFSERHDCFVGWVDGRACKCWPEAYVGGSIFSG